MDKFMTKISKVVQFGTVKKYIERFQVISPRVKTQLHLLTSYVTSNKSHKVESLLSFPPKMDTRRSTWKGIYKDIFKHSVNFKHYIYQCYSIQNTEGTSSIFAFHLLII